jgi:GDP-L-fucose synthase
MKMTPQTKIVIVGHGDVVEASLRAHFAARGFQAVASVGAFNPLDMMGTRSFFEREKPEVVILGSVRSGGIGINQAQPAEFIHDNLLSEVNVIDAAHRAGVQKLLFLAASCVYPKDSPQPMKEACFLTGSMEPTSLPYSTAKAAGIVMCQAYRRQYGFNAIAAVPATVYGANASTGEDVRMAHVLGALIAKFFRAVKEGEEAVELWGTGEARREFIFGEDLAAACVCLLENYDGEELINIGAGEDIAIKDLAGIVKDVSGFSGQIVWDRSKPDGAARKLLDSSRLLSMGWKPKVSLTEGITRTFEVMRRTG